MLINRGAGGGSYHLEMCVYCKRTPAALLGGCGALRALTDLSGPGQLNRGLLTRDLGAV